MINIPSPCLTLHERKNMWNVPLYHQDIFYKREIRGGEVWVPSHFTVYLKDCGMLSLAGLYASKYMHYRLTQYFLVFSKSTNIFNPMSLDETAYFELIYYVWIVGGLILPMRSRRLTRLSTSAKEVALWSGVVGVISSLSEKERIWEQYRHCL